MKKKFLIVTTLLSVLLLSLALFAACGKEEEFPTWNLSSGITASFSDDGNYGFVLTIDGSGAMEDFASKKDAPWYRKSGRVTKIAVADGITYIGSNSFTDCVAREARTVMLPESVTAAGANAFSAKAKVYAYAKISSDENVYCYSEEEPTQSGKYWHYVNDLVAEWPPVGEEVQPQNVLFVGNSYTYYNDMPVIFGNIANAAGVAVNVDSITEGSQRLYQWADPENARGKALYEKLEAKGDYDIIVLQEQSTNPINGYDSFLSGAQTLAAKIAQTQTNCQIYMYETWGSPLYGPNHGGIPEMESKLCTAYENAATAIGAKVSYVGKAFTYVYQNHTNINLYNADDTHPSYEGSFLSACVHAATMLGVDPRISTYNGSLDAATATLLKTAAYQIVFGS